MPKILILTLYCGENEYDACQKSIRDQDYNPDNVEHCFIENLTNEKAHKTLYQTIMDESENFDLFLKLDADMVLNKSSALSDIVRFWEENDHPDHIVFAVYDCLPDRLSMGVHLFSKECEWDINTHDDLFVDPNPMHDGRHLKIWDAPAPFVDHMPAPSDHAAYHFGLHRGLKAFQWDRFLAQSQALEAMRILQDTARCHQQTKNIKNQYALKGAEAARCQKTSLKTGDKLDILMDDLPIDFWSKPKQVWIYWWVMVGWRVVLGKILKIGRDFFLSLRYKNKKG